MFSKVASVLTLCIVVTGVASSAIPIWELLTYEEKMGRLMYVYVHLVERYCKTSTMPDCRKVMTLYGVSNLLNHDGHSLDLLDPDQRNASQLIWQAATKTRFKFPSEGMTEQEKKPSGGSSFGIYDVREEPSKVVVPAPKFLGRR